MCIVLKGRTPCYTRKSSGCGNNGRRKTTQNDRVKPRSKLLQENEPDQTVWDSHLKAWATDIQMHWKKSHKSDARCASDAERKCTHLVSRKIHMVKNVGYNGKDSYSNITVRCIYWVAKTWESHKSSYCEEVCGFGLLLCSESQNGNSALDSEPRPYCSCCNAILTCEPL